MKKQKICFVSSSRADYGLLKPLMHKVQLRKDFEFGLIATGSHFKKEFGYTYKEILSDGFEISKKVPLKMGSKNSNDIIESLSESILKISKAIKLISPDLIILLGDRYEIFGATQSATILGIPVAHLSGGDTASGTYDNFFRHAITKMSSLHFVTHKQAKKRVRQLGENPKTIFNYGSTCVENIKNTDLLTKIELEKALNFKFLKNSLLCTYHPCTIKNYDWKKEFLTLMKELAQLENTSIIITKSNADEGGEFINNYLVEANKKKENFYLFDSLGQKLYLSILKQSNAVIGNSSSGIYEAPYLKTPSIDIGVRQEDRASPKSIFRAKAQSLSIQRAIKEAEEFSFKNFKQIYGMGLTSEKIINKLVQIGKFENIISEKFYDLPLN